MQPDIRYLDKLNDQQRAAVEYNDGPSLVIAGAGSGKTRVLTYKIVHLINCGYEPWRILALTFTNKAAREMKERVAQLVNPATAAKIPMGTFHSQFLRILRRHAETLGFKSTFSIYDAADSRNLIKMIIKELGLSDKEYKPATIASTISNAKNAMMSSVEYHRDCYALDVKRKRPATSRIFSIYEERCRAANAMDFDDIIYYMNILLRDNPDIRQHYSEYFRYILVDEYQDTNFAQHLVISQLALPDNRICVVGDDAQSIYSFRGANINNIIDLDKYYPGLKTFKLERNYRSTKNIVNASGSLIERNTHKLFKTVYSENDEGAPVEVVQTYSDLEEAAVVVGKISESVLTCHDSYDDYAVLYRTNAQSRVLEEALRKRSMPYRIYGGTAFYQRKEVKDALSYFRVTVNPDDDEALRRIINFPARGIGDTTMKKLQHAASEAKVSLWQVITEPEKYNVPLNSGTLRKLDAFAEMMQNFIDSQNKLDAYEIGQDIMNRTGILSMYAYDTTPESISRLENLNELLNGMRVFVGLRNEEGNDDTGLTSFLSEVMLATDQDEKDAVDEPKVTLMTAHAAKGLEFKHVYIVGVEEELFPSAMSMDSVPQVEEERRLLYVAMTRAKETCMLSYARSRFRNGQTAMTSPSRFINEIDPRYLNIDTTGSAGKSAGFATPEWYSKPISSYGRTWKAPGSNSSGWNCAAMPDMSRFKPFQAASKPISGESHQASELKEGMLISHNKFGTGKIIAKGNVSGSDSITVDFGDNGVKKLLLTFAKFDILK